MAASLVHQAYSSSASNSSPQNVTITSPALNNILIAIVHYNSTSTVTTSSISGGSGGTWSLAIRNADAADTTYPQVLEVWYSVVTSPSATVSFTSGTTGVRAEYAVLEYSGVATSNILDQTASANTGNTTSSTLSCGTTASTVNANELVLEIVAYYSLGSTLAPTTGSFPFGHGTLNYNTGYTGLTGVSQVTVTTNPNEFATGIAIGWKNVSSIGTQTGTISDPNATDSKAIGPGVIVTFALGSAVVVVSRRRTTASFI